MRATAHKIMNCTAPVSAFGIRHSAFGIRHSAFGIRHSAFGIRHLSCSTAIHGKLQARSVPQMGSTVGATPPSAGNTPACTTYNVGLRLVRHRSAPLPHRLAPCTATPAPCATSTCTARHIGLHPLPHSLAPCAATPAPLPHSPASQPPPPAPVPTSTCAPAKPARASILLL